jgi:hypothetical protein
MDAIVYVYFDDTLFLKVCIYPKKRFLFHIVCMFDSKIILKNLDIIQSI